MDYIREELLRQSLLWQRLLQGEASQKQELEAQETWDQAAGSGQERPEAAEIRERAGRRKAEENPAEKPVQKRTMQPEETVESPAEYTAADMAADADVWEMTQEAWRIRGPGAQTSKGKARRWMVPVQWMGSMQAAPTAREISRIFQRDARRYDGAFTLY